MDAYKELGFTKAVNFCLYSFLSLILPLFFLPPIRSFIILFLGGKIGKNAILMNIKFINLHQGGFSSLKIGSKSFIGEDCLFDLYNSINIEENVTFGPRVTLITHTNVGYKDHPLQKFIPKSSEKITIKKGSFIGSSTTILPGVEIGENSIVGAGSLVNKNVKKNSIYAGVPAKFIKKLQSEK